MEQEIHFHMLHLKRLVSKTKPYVLTEEGTENDEAMEKAWEGILTTSTEAVVEHDGASPKLPIYKTQRDNYSLHFLMFIPARQYISNF